MNDLYATIIIEVTNEVKVDGKNKLIIDAVETLDNCGFDVSEVSFNFKPHRVRMSIEVHCTFDGMKHPLRDETDAEEYVRGQLEPRLDFNVILIDPIETEFVP